MSASDYVVEKTTLISGRGLGNLEEWRFKDGRVAHKSRVYHGDKQSLETWDGLTRTEAKRKHVERNGKTAKGETPTTKRLLDEVKEECFAYLTDLAAREDGSFSTGTLQNYTSAWRKRIATKPISKLRLDQIGRAECLRFLRDLRTSDLATSTQNGTVTSLRAVLHYARDMEWMSFDPFSGIPSKEFPPQKPSTGIISRALSNEESQKLIDAARSEAFREQTDTLYTNLIIVTRYQGPRSGEAIGLRWREIDLIAETIGFVGQIPRKHKVGEPIKIIGPKNGESGKREPQMFPEVWAALNDQLIHEQCKGLGEDDDLVFTTAAGGPITRDSLREAVKRAGVLAGLGRVVPKDLRTSWFTAGVNAGVAPVELAAMGGNSAPVVERFYAKPMRTAAQGKLNVGKFAASGF